MREIGVSNFGIGHIEKLLQTAKVVPAVNQIELSPFLQRKDLVAYCRSKGIALEVSTQLLRVIQCICRSAYRMTKEPDLRVSYRMRRSLCLHLMRVLSISARVL